MNKRWALITGASSGIGMEFARICAKNGFNVVLSGRNADRLNDLANQLKGACDVKVAAQDLAEFDGASNLFKSTAAQGIDVSVLINNAGFGADGFFAEEDLDLCTTMVQTNVTALMALTRLYLPSMLAQRRGNILNVASTAAFQPGPKMAVYYASKAFVFSFSNALANELKGTGVQVTTLCPGPTRTEFHARAGTTRSEAVMRRWMMPADEVARVGFDAMMRGKRNVTPGFANKIGVTLAKLVPAQLSAAVARKVIEG